MSIKIKAIDFTFGKWRRTKTTKPVYLVVDTARARTTWLELGNVEAMPAKEFDTIEKARQHIDRTVSKDNHEYARLFQEIPHKETANVQGKVEPHPFGHLMGRANGGGANSEGYATCANCKAAENTNDAATQCPKQHDA